MLIKSNKTCTNYINYIHKKKYEKNAKKKTLQKSSLSSSSTQRQQHRRFDLMMDENRINNHPSWDPNLLPRYRLPPNTLQWLSWHRLRHSIHRSQCRSRCQVARRKTTLERLRGVGGRNAVSSRHICEVVAAWPSVKSQSTNRVRFAIDFLAKK